MRPRLAVTLTLAWIVLALAPGARAVRIREELVSFETHDGLILEGILSFPRNAPGPFPGMLLIAGSGVHDADVTLDEPVLRGTRGEQKLFRSLGRYLSRKGFAVLRCNKRGATFDHVADQPGILEASTFDDLVEDALEAFDTLASHPRVAAHPLVVYGISEGALIAPRLARRESRVDLVVLVGSAARKGTQILQYQLVERPVHFYHRAADQDRDAALTMEELDRLDGNHGLGSYYVYYWADYLYESVAHSDGTIEVTGLNQTTDGNGDQRLDIETENRPAIQRDADVYVSQGRSGLLGRYFQTLINAQPLLSFIHRVDAPILFAQGELDVQAPVEETLALIDKLERKGRENWDAIFFPKLGHSLSKPNDFITDDGGLTVLDNPTVNAMKKKTMRKLHRRIVANLP
jgi:dienelactone hydrolase